MRTSLPPTIQSASAALFTLYRWWIGELRAMARPMLRRWALQPLAFEFDRSGFRAQGGGLAMWPVGEWADAVAGLRRTRPALNSVRLVLGRDLALLQSCLIPAAATARAGEILALRLEQVTPFKRSDVSLGWRHESAAPGSGQVRLRTAIVKRSLLKSLANPLVAAGVERIAVVVADEPDIAVRLPRELVRARGRLPRALALISWASLVVAGGAVCGGFWLSSARHAAAAADLDSRIAEVGSRAAAVRRRYEAARAALSRLDGLRRERTERPTALALLDEISRAVPDGAWLTELQIDGETVQLSGLAASAADLLPQLDRAPDLEDAAFVSPVIRDPQQNADRFVISLRLAPAVAKTGGGGS